MSNNLNLKKMKNVFYLGDSKFQSGADGLKEYGISQKVLSFPAKLTGTVKGTPLRISDRLLGLRSQDTLIALATTMLTAVTLLIK